MHKILVTVKRLPDYESTLRIGADQKSIDMTGIKWIVNPFDEIAVEEAVRIKESRDDVEVVVLSIGSEDAAEQVRAALAIGADRGIVVTTDQAVDSDGASKIIKAIAEQEQVSLIIIGKQSVDSDANQTGQLLAARMNVAQAMFASKVELAADWSQAQVTCEVDGGLQTVSVALPAVVSTDLRLNEPRYPSLPNIVKAKKKPLDFVPVASLGLDTTAKVVVRKLRLPAGRKAGVKVASVAELVDKLRNEAKVI